MLAAKTLSLIPGTHMMEGENQFLQDVKKYLISVSCKFCNFPLQSHKSGKQLVRGDLSGAAVWHSEWPPMLWSPTPVFKPG